MDPERPAVHLAVLAIVPDATTGDLASANVTIERATDAGHRIVAQDLASTEAEIRTQITRWIGQAHNDVVIVVGDDRGATRAALAPLVTEALPGFGSVWAARCSSKLVLVLPAAPSAAKLAMDTTVLPKLDGRRSDSVVRLLPRLAGVRGKPRTGRNVVKRDDDDFADPPTKPIDVDKLEQQIAMASADNPTRQVDLAKLSTLLGDDDGEPEEEELLRRPAIVKRPPASPAKTTVSIPTKGMKTPAMGTPITAPPPPPPKTEPIAKRPAVQTPPLGTPIKPIAATTTPNTAPPPPKPLFPPPPPPTVAAVGTGAVARQEPITVPVARQAPATGPVAKQEPTKRAGTEPGAPPVTASVPKLAPSKPPGARPTLTPDSLKTPPLGSPVTTPPSPPKPPPEQRRSPAPTPPMPSPVVKAEVTPVPEGTVTTRMVPPATDRPKWPQAAPDTVVDQPAAEVEPASTPVKSAEPTPFETVTPPARKGEPPPPPRKPAAPSHTVLVTREPEPEPTEDIAELDADLIENTPRPFPIIGLPKEPPPSGPVSAQVSAQMSAQMNAVDPTDELAPNEAQVVAPMRATPIPSSQPKPPMPMGRLPVAPSGFEGSVPEPLSPRAVRADKTVMVLRRGPSKGVIALLLIAAACAVIAAIVVVTHQPKDKAVIPDAAIGQIVEPPVVAQADPTPSPDAAEPEIDFDPSPVKPSPVTPPPHPNPLPHGNPPPVTPPPRTNSLPPVTPPLPVAPPKEGSGSAAPAVTPVDPAKPARPGISSEPGCDEVSCVLDRYARACCAPFKPADAGFDPKKTMPDRLDRTMVKEGVERMKPRVIACGEKTSAKGTVKLSIAVGPAGNVTDVSVSESPDAALGECVAAALRKASFGKTINGATFVYPFVF